MFTASEKKRENIAEYLLYMWNIEDLIRANNLDLDKIESTIIANHTSLTLEQRKQMTEWYESLIDMMRRENVVEKGHLQLNKNVIIDLENLSRRLLKDPKFSAYATQYYATLPLIVELRARSGEDKPGEIEACFNALYGTMLLRMQGKEISDDTKNAIARISKFLALLAAYYKKDYNNELDIEEQ